ERSDGASEVLDCEFLEPAHVACFRGELRSIAVRQSSALSLPSASFERIFLASGLVSSFSRTSRSAIVEASVSDGEFISLCSQNNLSEHLSTLDQFVALGRLG